MTTTSWARGVSGFFNAPSNWTNGVPMAGNTALITAKGTYSVVSLEPSVIATLEMAKDATLAILPGSPDIPDTLDVTSGTGAGAFAGTITIAAQDTLELGADFTATTFDNAGAIDTQSEGSLNDPNGVLQIDGTVTLTGKGQINLLGVNTLPAISGGAPFAKLINDGNTISGTGLIGDENLSFVNDAKGVVDSNKFLGGIELETQSAVNLGLMEATEGSELSFATDVTQSGKGEIKAATPVSLVTLLGATISGGLVATVKGAYLYATSFDSAIDNQKKAINNAGTIDVNGGGSLTIEGAVKNTGALVVETIASLTVDGAVEGGAAEIMGSGRMSFSSASSANVSFASGSTGALILKDASQFTGTVTGMTGNPDAAIDLENISFADNPVVSPVSAKGVLTVADPVTHTVDTIKIVGGGMFTASLATDGSTLISDTLLTPATVPLLAQSMASFGASTAVAASSGASGDDHHQSLDFLASPHWG